jgi:hypothetical protein
MPFVSICPIALYDVASGAVDADYAVIAAV